MPLLTLKRTPSGVPDRLHLKCSHGAKDLAHKVGRGTARWAATLKRWTYPVDPVIIRNVIQEFPHAQISDDLLEYLDRGVKQQQLLWDVTQDTSPFADNRLWPYQCASVRFLLEGKRVVLAHDMGLGKTVIGCAAIAAQGGSRVLIVCPNSVKWSWVDHIQEWADREDIYVLGIDKPREHVEVLSGTRTERNAALWKLFGTTTACVLVTNYEQVGIHQKVLTDHDWDIVIVDEAHRIKNPKTARSKAIKAVADKAAYFWPMTGTPMRNCYSDFFGILHAVDPVRFSSYWNFIRLHLDSVPGIWGGVEILGPADRTAFNAMLASYMFRRTKEEVLPDLPDKIVIDRPLTMPEDQAAAYQQMEKEFILYITKQLDNGDVLGDILYAPETIAQIIRLRQICLTPEILGGAPSSAKLEALYDIFEGMDGERMIVYTCFKAFLPYIKNILDELEIPYGEIVGGQTSANRYKVEQQLKSGDIKVVLGTIQAMGEGLNLQAASVAVFCDIDWVPAVNEQAEDRIHRPGIKTSPTIIKLYHPETIEEDIRATCIRKERAIEATVGRMESLREMLRRHNINGEEVE